MTIREELAFVKDYLSIERLRFEDQLTVALCADEATLGALVPSFILQPLIENSIRHGAGTFLQKIHVDVAARCSQGRLLIRVDDNGAGLPHGWSLEDHAGVGLSNISRRLKELYRSEQTFMLVTRPEGGVRVEIALPLQMKTPGVGRNSRMYSE